MKIRIVLPVYNEERIVRSSLQKLLSFCQLNLAIDWQIVVADNASTDKTREIVEEIIRTENNNDKIEYFHLSQKGKGLAVLSAWQKFPADSYCFMDADLATDLESLPVLITKIKEGHDLVIGSRRHRQSRVKRSLVKKIVSWVYSLLVRLLLKSKFKDYPCGFKAVNQKVMKEIIPQIKNQQWFFDTELVILAEKGNYNIKEIPVIWSEPKNRKSRVKTLPLAINYLKEVWRLKKRLKRTFPEVITGRSGK